MIPAAGFRDGRKSAWNRLPQMPSDRAGRLEGALARGIDDQLRRGHPRPIEGSGLVELPVLVDVAQCAEALARLRRDPLLDLRIAALELDEVDGASAGL